MGLPRQKSPLKPLPKFLSVVQILLRTLAQVSPGCGPASFTEDAFRRVKGTNKPSIRPLPLSLSLLTSSCPRGLLCSLNCVTHFHAFVLAVPSARRALCPASLSAGWILAFAQSH